MKRLSFLAALLILFASISYAQLIDNRGNRNQTYPNITVTNPTVVEMTHQVDTVNLYNTVAWMQQYIRDATKPEALLVQNYLLDRFDEIGLETYVHNHTSIIGGTDTLDAGNVIAVQPGTEFPDEYVIIASHYDHPDGPGADDNASGTAGVLECARILSQYEFKRTILYIPFNGEERWMVGSYPFVQKCAHEEMNILGVFDMDMIGFWPGPEYGEVTMYSGCSYISERLFEYYQQVANLYLPEMHTYRFTKQDSYGGDHMSFNAYEYPALYIGDIEYHAENIYYHTPGDSIGTGLNCFALSNGFVRAVVAAAAELANGWLAPQDFSAVVENGEVLLSWNDAPETESYRLFKDNELLAETTETSFVDAAFVDGEWHRYYVKGVNANGDESPASNMDSIFTKEPLQIPVFYDFEDGTAEGLILNNDNWHFGLWKQHRSLKAETFTYDNILQTAEFQWFTIPESIDNLVIGFKMHKRAGGMWFPHNVNVFVEVTTDRKTWHKIGVVNPNSQNQWASYTFSLNDFIGCDYVQPRIRFEGSGQGNTTSNSKYIIIDDLFIDFDETEVSEHPAVEKFQVNITPNPSNGQITITTGLNHSYSVSVYSMTGQRIIKKDAFCDGSLNLCTLPKGIYYLTIDHDRDRVSKRIVIQ